MKLKKLGTAAAVVLFILLAAAALVPGFIHPHHISSQNACINNLRQIDGAIQQWALEHDKKPDDVVTLTNLKPFLGRGTEGEIPTCPSGGTYSVSRVKDKAKCSIGGEGHTLE